MSETLGENNIPLKTSFSPFWTAFIFLPLTILVTIDEFKHPSTLGLHSTKVATVPLFNAWTIGWNANRLKHGFADYWEAPIFYPAKKTFAYSEPQPATLLVAPIVIFTGSIIWGYKAYLWLSLWLNAYFAGLLLSRLSYSRWMQILGGAGILLLPIVHHRIDVIQLVPVWGILWFWSSLFQFSKFPSRVRSVELGTSYAICFYLCVHHSLFLSLLLPISCVVFLKDLLNWKFISYGLLSALIGVALILPLILPIHEAANENDFARKAELVSQLSAKPADYLNSQSNSLLKVEKFQKSKSRQFCVGWGKMFIALVGTCFIILNSYRRKWGLFLLLTGGTAFALSLGPNFQIGEWKLWESLSQHIPGVSQVRSVYRFVWFFQIAIVFLAVEGISGILNAYTNRKRSKLQRIALLCILIAMSTLFVVDVLPPKTVRAGVPKVARQMNWINYLRTNSSPDQLIACLPFATGKSVSDYDVTSRWMCYGLEHQIPMVNGYSGFFPENYLKIKRKFDINGPTVSGIEELRKLDVEFIIVSRNYSTINQMLKLRSLNFTIEHVFEDNLTNVDIYRLKVVE